MAIKRSAKSRGTPVRKPVSSAAVRHVEVRPKHQLAAGTLYEGWLCKNASCGLVIAIALPADGSRPAAAFEDYLTALKCPHCGNEDLYRWNTRAEHKYVPKGVEA
jgi:rubredoxin